MVIIFGIILIIFALLLISFLIDYNKRDGSSLINPTDKLFEVFNKRE